MIYSVVKLNRMVAVVWAMGAMVWAVTCPAMGQDAAQPAKKRYRGVIGPGSKKVKVADGKTLLWAGGEPDGPHSKWFDFTDALIPAEELQFGIGADRIRAIDDPLFVSPDDPRLLKLRPSHYRRDERPKTRDEIMVIGFADGSDARAYPVALLDGHELVNDRIGGKPVSVGW